MSQQTQKQPAPVTEKSENNEVKVGDVVAKIRFKGHVALEAAEMLESLNIEKTPTITHAAVHQQGVVLRMHGRKKLIPWVQIASVDLVG